MFEGLCFWISPRSVIDLKNACRKLCTTIPCNSSCATSSCDAAFMICSACFVHECCLASPTVAHDHSFNPRWRDNIWDFVDIDVKIAVVDVFARWFHFIIICHIILVTQIRAMRKTFWNLENNWRLNQYLIN